MKSLGSTENKTTKNKICENVPHLEVTEAVLVHCNIINNHHQQHSRVIYAFVPNKIFVSLLEISPKNHIFFTKKSSEFQEIKVLFTVQNSQPLEIEDKRNLTLIIK